MEQHDTPETTPAAEPAAEAEQIPTFGSLEELLTRLVRGQNNLHRRLARLESEVLPGLQTEIVKLHQAVQVHQRLFEMLAKPAAARGPKVLEG